MEDLDFFAKRLRSEREKAGLTQEELGARLGVSGSMVAQYESTSGYARHPKPNTIVRFADALKIPVSALLGIPYGDGVHPKLYPCALYIGDSTEPEKAVRFEGSFAAVHRCPICGSEVNGLRDNFCRNCGVRLAGKEQDDAGKG